jgi:four helix bundle protein
MENRSRLSAGLWNFGAYSKARQLFELLVSDLHELKQHHGCARLVAQQISSADSISSNIEEGFGRGSKKDYSHFLIIARGSTQETAGRYERLQHWLPPGTADKRVALCGEIIGILSASINTLRSEMETETASHLRAARKRG